MVMNFQKSGIMFGRARELEGQIDEFLDKVTEAGLIFSHAVGLYLEKGPCRDFEAFLSRVEETERRSDDLRRDIETKLYAHTLIPELRGDVLSLLEHLDNLVNMYEANLFRFSIQQPDIPVQFDRDYSKLTETVITCVESLVLASRSFFRDLNAVRDQISKVIFYESEADRISTALQRSIFASDLGLDRKRHLSYFVENIDEVANSAEDVADELARVFRPFDRTAHSLSPATFRES